MKLTFIPHPSSFIPQNMTPERWEKIEDIFQSALDCETRSEREAFLRTACGADSDLRAEVEKLIARFEAEDEFLESPVWTDSQLLGKTFRSRVARSLEEEIDGSRESFSGRKIGVYLLTEQIGKGGMGVVYAAERADNEFSQKVAVKLIKRGMDTDFIVRRFRHERQILANLNHPNIARLLDGGTTDDDLPYFIMEFIEGEQFLKYSESRNLDLSQKLELFLPVCAAVSYAHKRKIIHRDIKPSNILITDEGTPKLLDFGIAKLLDTDSVNESVSPTATAMRLMTPEYASPEQARGEEITAASDQYSLGVLLYELLTGERPYKFTSRAPHEIARVICEEIPSEPSSGNFGKNSFENDQLRIDEASCIKLDRIVLKTLRKEPAQRYASVEELSADIKRFLNNESVLAESFAERPNEINAAENVIEKTTTVKARSNGGELSGADSEKMVSPRGRGIKQGFFTIVVSILLIPILLIIALTRSLPPPLIFFIFFAAFLGGLIRVIYALFFESGETVPPEINLFAEAETQIINSSAARETVFGNQTTAEKTSESEKSIAVLPFLNLKHTLGETTGGEYLTIGLADALITRLSNVKQLLVRPTSSVLRFAAEETDAFATGRKLAVEYLLTGNFLKTGKKIRISVQLLDVEKEATVWAERFDEEFTDFLNIEDSITAKVAESVLPRLTGEERRQIEKRGTDNREAYEAYLRGRFYWNTFTEEGFRQARFYYEKAIEYDSRYALAYAGLTDYYLWLGAYAMTPPKDCFPPARACAEKAVELDDESAEAHSALGFATLCTDYDWQKSEKSALRAFELNPNYVSTYLWYASHHFGREQYDEGLRLIRQAITLDPLSFQTHNSLAYGLYFARRFEEAIAKAVDNTKRFPAFSLPYNALANFLRVAGRTEEALEASTRAVKLSTDLDRLHALFGRVSALAAAGRRAEAVKLLAELDAQSSEKHISPREKIIAYASLGEKEKSLDALEKSFAEGELLIWLKCDPTIDLLRDDPRFHKILEKINLAPDEKSASKSPTPEKSFESTAKRDRSNKSKRAFPSALKFVLAIIGFAFLGFLVYKIAVHTTYDASAPQPPVPPELLWKNVFASSMRAKRLTTTGKAKFPALSPDGSKIAYISDESGSQQSLWIRAVDNDDAKQLIPPAQGYYTDLKFSPDGEYVYYIVRRQPKRTLYRVRASGGAEEKVSENAFYMFAFSPDGRRIVYDYLNPDNNQRGLFIAQLNEKSLIKTAEMLFVLDLPNFFTGGISFSPDGKKIAYSRSRLEEGNKQVVNLFSYDLETRANQKICDRDFDDITKIEWRANGEEIVASAKESDSAPQQLWVIEVSTGEVSRLTNDFTDYQGVGLTADSSALITAKTDSVSAVWTSDLTAENRESSFKQITNGFDRRDGLNGVSWTKDGRIVYAAGAETERNISIINADGTNNQVIPTGANNPILPSLTSDNLYLIYSDIKDREFNIWRFDMTTRKLEKINSRYAVTPSIAPDNRSVVYAMLPAADSNSLIVHRKSLDADGEEKSLTSGLSVRPIVSPDGRLVACNYDGEETENAWQIAILPFDGNYAPRFLKVYTDDKFFRNPQTRSLAWSADGQFLYFLNYKDNVVNIFRVSVKGNLPPVQITNFTSGEIFDFAITADNRKVAIARGAVTSDLVIYKTSNN